MKYCVNCGEKVDVNAGFCNRCGTKINGDVSNQQISNDNGGFGWSVLGFFIPVVGLILYLVWKNERPKTAKSVGKGALVYLIFYIAILVISFIIGFVGAIVEEANGDYYDDYYYDDEYYDFE